MQQSTVNNLSVCLSAEALLGGDEEDSAAHSWALSDSFMSTEAAVREDSAAVSFPQASTKQLTRACHFMLYILSTSPLHLKFNLYAIPAWMAALFCWDRCWGLSGRLKAPHLCVMLTWGLEGFGWHANICSEVSLGSCLPHWGEIAVIFSLNLSLQPRICTMPEYKLDSKVIGVSYQL